MNPARDSKAASAAHVNRERDFEATVQAHVNSAKDFEVVSVKLVNFGRDFEMAPEAHMSLPGDFKVPPGARVSPKKGTEFHRHRSIEPGREQNSFSAGSREHFATNRNGRGSSREQK